MPKLCNYKNCRKRACYALTYGNADRCKEHKEDRKGQYSVCNCGKAIPSFNEPGERRAICCSQCKTETMVDLRGERKNEKCKCGKRPSFNEPGQTRPNCCKDCKTDTMIRMGHGIYKKCKCGKRPSFNEPGERRAICCSQCKTETMVDLRGERKNEKCKCGKRSTFNEPGKTRAICCNNCKTESMINVKDKKCKANSEVNCDMRANRKYKGYCTRCFQQLFPTDPLTFQIRSKSKEIAVRDFINANFDGWNHDNCLYTGHCNCTIRRRIDHRILIGNTLLAVETDENQHKSYDDMDEETRYDDLFMAFSGKWIYIRFNPDKYKSKNGKNRNPEIATRLIELKKEIEKQINRIKNEENTEILERIYMYYDNYN